MCIPASCSYLSNPFFIPVNLQPLSKAWKCETPTLRPSLTSSPPTHTSWSSCQIPQFVSSKRQRFSVHLSKGLSIIKRKYLMPLFAQHLQPLSSTFEMPGNTLRSWSVWTDPSTACTCGCASQYFSLCPLGHSQPITPQMTWGVLFFSFFQLRCILSSPALFPLYLHIQSQ